MKKLTAFIVAAIILMGSLTVYADVPQVSAPAAILIDSETGRVLYEKNADAKMYPASTTKIMTGLLASEYENLDEEVTANNDVFKIEKGSSQIYINPGEILTMRQLLYALMLESANDAAIVIADHLGGSIEGFAAMMNERAKSIGAVNTNFVNPNGLHDDNHYTTARDLAIIAREAMKNPIFREVVGTFHYEIPATNKQEARNYITNSNKMIWQVNNQYKYEPAIGIKTGYTVKAQHCLVGGAQKNNMELISVVLGASKDSVYTDTIAMLEYGFANFKKLDLLKKDMIVTTIELENGDRKLNLLAAEDLSITGREEDIAEILQTKNIKLKEDLKAPVNEGDVIGTISYSIDGKETKGIELIAEEDVKSTRLIDRIIEFKNQYSWGQIALAFVVLFLAWRTIVTYIKLRRRKNRMFYSRGRKRSMFLNNNRRF